MLHCWQVHRINFIIVTQWREKSQLVAQMWHPILILNLSKLPHLLGTVHSEEELPHTFQSHTSQNLSTAAHHRVRYVTAKPIHRPAKDTVSPIVRTIRSQSDKRPYPTDKFAYQGKCLTSFRDEIESRHPYHRPAGVGQCNTSPHI